MADLSPSETLTEDQRRLLVAVVEGYRARAGMKDRIRALNEWEIARRSGSTSLSYGEYMHDAMRDQVASVLGELERRGLISTWERGPSYDTYVPTERGNVAAAARDATDPGPLGTEHAEPPTTASDPVMERLDEILRVLRSIDSRLTR